MELNKNILTIIFVLNTTTHITAYIQSNTKHTKYDSKKIKKEDRKKKDQKSHKKTRKYQLLQEAIVIWNDTMDMHQ